jgi:hypothetical protein
MPSARPHAALLKGLAEPQVLRAGQAAIKAGHAALAREAAAAAAAIYPAQHLAEQAAQEDCRAAQAAAAELPPMDPHQALAALEDAARSG